MATKIYKVQSPDGSIIEIEGPVGASQEEVIAKAKELSSSRMQPRQETPSNFLDYLRTQPLLEPFTRQTIRGAAVDPINALRQLTTEGQREAVAREEAAYQAEREARGEEGYEYGRLTGNILSPLALGAGAAAIRGVGGVGRIAQIRQAAGAGAAGALLQPVLDEDVEFADEKVRQLSLGALTGSLLEGGIQGVTGGIKFVRDLVKPMSEDGRAQLLRNFINKLAGPDREKVVSALRNAEEIVPGSRPTAAEAISDIPSATGLGAFQRRLETDQATAPGFATRGLEQETARAATIGVDETGIPLMQAYREAQTAPLRQEALEQANIAGRIAPQLEADIAAREASRIQALQTQGQLQTRAAEQGVLSQTEFTPVPGFPRVASKYRPNIDREAEAITAAKETGDIAAQRLAETNFKKLQLQSLKDEGFYALKADPLVSRIDQILKTPGDMASDVTQDVLSSLRFKLTNLNPEAGPVLVNSNGVIDSRNLYTIRKEIADDINKFAGERMTSDKGRLAALENNLKKIVDNSIEKAGGVKWKDYLKNYANYSEKINQIQIGQLLSEKLQTPLGDAERAGAFALAVQNAASTIKKATGAPRYKTIGEALNESQLKAVNSVTADLQRNAKAGKLKGIANIKNMETGETPDVPSLLNRTAMLGNFILRAAKKNAFQEMNKNAAELFLDPQKLAIFMQQPNSASAIKAIFDKLDPQMQDFLERVVTVQVAVQPITPLE